MSVFPPQFARYLIVAHWHRDVVSQNMPYIYKEVSESVNINLSITVQVLFGKGQCPISKLTL